MTPKKFDGGLIINKIPSKIGRCGRWQDSGKSGKQKDRGSFSIDGLPQNEAINVSFRIGGYALDQEKNNLHQLDQNSVGIFTDQSIKNWKSISNRNTINNEKQGQPGTQIVHDPQSIKCRSINRNSLLFLLQSVLVLYVLLFGSCRKENVVDDKPLTELAKLINNTPLENVQSIALIDSSQNKTTELWRHQNIKPEQWKAFKQVLIKYMNDFDRNQLGAVMPLHTLTIECHEFEINVTLYAVKDSEDTDNPFIANLTKSLAE